MSIAMTRWACSECWSLDGLLLPTDVFIPLDGSPEAGYRAASSVLLAELLSRGDGDWVEVDPFCRCRDESRGILVEAGGGSLETEGFVAVSDAGGLMWVLHLYDSEAFTAVRVEGDEVVAVAEEYPFRNEFRIPITDPSRLRVRSKNLASPPHGE